MWQAVQSITYAGKESIAESIMTSVRLYEYADLSYYEV